MFRTLSFAIATTGLIAGAAQATPPASPPKETSIPFANRDGIQDFKADGDRGLYIRDIRGQWYYARTMGKCARLQWANNVGFETSGSDRLDRFGALHAVGWRCPLESLVRSDAPPKKAKRG